MLISLHVGAEETGSSTRTTYYFGQQTPTYSKPNPDPSFGSGRVYG